ncbi:MAG: acetyl-CoA carboxylase biotin carboxyl carrier protein [Beijerinckiaceae bacterium]
MMPISVTRLRELIALAAAQGVDGLDLVEDGTHIVITRNGLAPIQMADMTTHAVTPASSASETLFAAPMFGVFHLTSAPGAKPFVAVGDAVARGQQLCLIEAMKTFNAISSDRDGRIEAILAEPGTEIATGQPLFRIAKA